MQEHIRRILRSTLPNYKEWVECDMPPTLKDVLEKYIVLRNPEWVRIFNYCGFSYIIQCSGNFNILCQWMLQDAAFF